MNIANVYFSKEQGNCGDQMVSPFDYFPRLAGTRLDMRQQIEEMMGYHLIFGGGGIMHSGSQSKLDWLTRVSSIVNPNAKLIMWSAGLNHHDRTDLLYPEWLDRFDLIGCRDWGNPFEYVPCVSCMHPDFDRAMKTQISNEVVVFSHHGSNAFSIAGTPRMTNAKSASEFLAVLQFLASAETVVSNSFHGLYWAMLLGRKAVCWKPFSNRFRGFKPVLGFCDETNYKEKISEAVIATDYLTECRDINRAFAEKVMECIKGDAYKYEEST